jgi:hypothetical protein
MHLDDKEYTQPDKFRFRESVLELHVVALARCVILSVLYCQGSAIGTMYRAGRDGHSHWQTVLVRFLVVTVPVASVLLLIVQAAVFDYKVSL